VTSPPAGVATLLAAFTADLEKEPVTGKPDTREVAKQQTEMAMSSCPASTLYSNFFAKPLAMAIDSRKAIMGMIAMPEPMFPISSPAESW